MKFLIVGVCLLTFMSWTPKEAEVRTEPTDQTKIRAKASNHNYEEEFLIKRAAEVKKKKVAKTQKPVAKKVKPKAKVVKKETTKPASPKETKPKISVTAKTSTPPKTETKPKIAKTSAPAKAKTKPKVSKTSTSPKTKAKPKVVKTSAPPKTKANPKVSVTAKTPTPPKTESTPKKTKEISFELSFYTTLPEHNGGYAKTASGENIVGLKNVVASNYYPLGTKIYLEGFGTVRVADRGGPDFNSSVRLDVLIQRKSGESDKAYAARVWDMGRQTIDGYIVE